MLEAQSTPGPQCGRIMQLKNFKVAMGNRTRDLPGCNIQAQPTAPLLVHNRNITYVSPPGTVGGCTFHLMYCRLTTACSERIGEWLSYYKTHETIWTLNRAYLFRYALFSDNSYASCYTTCITVITHIVSSVDPIVILHTLLAFPSL
jgi:hypothetical protein